MNVKILSRLGLDRRELRAWAMYDWANSAFQTTIITAVFPDFFAAVAAADLPPAIATARYAWATTIAVGIVAVMGPILGAIADYRAMKKRMLGAFMAIGVVATLMMATIDRGEWMYASILFIVANICIAASFVFYDSLLPHIARPDEMDRVSTAAYAMGYLGGGLLLVINLDEADVADAANVAQAAAQSGLSAFLSHAATAAVPVCAKIELEIAALDEADAKAFLADLGLKESGLDRVIRASYDLLGYMSFFTVGEDECRAWSIPRGTIAQDAAGEIHSDIARGFIRAEVIAVNDLLELRTEARCREAGKLRVEGKEYVVQDGDVIHFRFNV